MLLLGPLEALLGPSWDHLEHLKRIKPNKQKHSKTLIRIAFLGLGDSQERPKITPSWVKLASKEVPKPSWQHFEPFGTRRGLQGVI